MIAGRLTDGRPGTRAFERLTRVLALDLQVELPLRIDHAALLEDLRCVRATFRASPLSVVDDYEGGWTSIGLLTSGGRVEEDRYRDKVGEPYLPTPALAAAPSVRALLDRLPGEKNRVRFLALEPRAEIHWHADGIDTIDRNVRSPSARFHVPLLTNPDVDFRICHETCAWAPGRLYYGDFSFPHRVSNRGDTTRIHLVIDVVPSDALRALFPSAFLAQARRRALARPLCRTLAARRAAGGRRE